MSEVKKMTRRVALYRKYRPRNLSDVIGQSQVTEILAAVEKSRDFSHAYLFTGQRGTGKTSVARILAHIINQSDYHSEKTEDIDIIEIDAASQSGVDDIRELRDNVQLAPMSHAHKIYIIDEVHMLSTAAFNALLKTIEEPPSHVIFILATTEIHKLPATILSRVQRFHFQPVSPKILHAHLREISDCENIEISDSALDLIVEYSGGSVRDALTLLDQMSASKEKISPEKVEQILGIAPNKTICEIINLTSQNNLIEILEKINQLLKNGENPKILSEQIAKKFAENATQNPQIFRLIDKILDVKNSSLPELKLQSVFADFLLPENSQNFTENSRKHSEQKNKTMSQIVAEKSEKIIEKSDQNIAKNFSEKENVAPEKIRENSQKNKDNKEGILSENQKKTQKTDSEKMENSEKKSLNIEFNWSDFLEKIKEKTAPTAAILAQANYDFDGEKLTLYFAKKIYREQMKRAKYQKILADNFAEIYNFSSEISIANGAKMARDSKNDVLKKIAKIMDGGEIIKEAK